jgi:acyl-CoA reductase-like NAD-dependent aldehyde dehydrogenase
MTTETARLAHYINGEWVQGDGDLQHTVNPARPEHFVSSWYAATNQIVDDALAAGAQAAESWRATTPHQRAEILRRTADLIEARTDEIAQNLADEQGKVLFVCRSEVGRAAAIFRYFSHDADTATGSMYNSPRRGERIFTDRVPVGQVLCITPWNVPLGIPAWKIAPALAHGNTVLWKPSDVTPLVSVRIVEALAEAGLPAGVLNVFLGRPEQAERALRDPRIAACTFTGSTAVGQHLRKLGAERGIDVLAEMGGKNAAIVLADADLPWAAAQVVAAAMGWSGQRCTATSRIIVEKPVVDEFTELLIDRVNRLTVAAPNEFGADIGPVSTERQFASISASIAQGVEQGAQVLAGGVPQRGECDGFFIAPTLLGRVDTDNILFRQELFGPVAAIIGADDATHALALANEGEYGLSGSIFTTNIDFALTLMDGFDVGVIHINAESCGADTHVPFGGFGASGTRHKEMGEQARDFYTKIRTVYIRGAAL